MPAVEEVVWRVLREQASEIVSREPKLEVLVRPTILNHGDFGSALVMRLSTKLRGELLTKEFYADVFNECIEQSRGTPIDVTRLAMEDLIACEQRDPACKSIAQAFLYFKGLKSVQCYRMAHVLWTQGRKDLAMTIQARCTEVFGVDLHPAAKIGGGLMIDHGTGVVVGETATVGHGCTFLHGVTLGSTGKELGFDRHPKVGNHVFLGAQSTVLGNISIGDHVTIGSGSLVLKPLPAGATAVGSPAVVKTIATTPPDSPSPLSTRHRKTLPPSSPLPPPSPLPLPLSSQIGGVNGDAAAAPPGAVAALSAAEPARAEASEAAQEAGSSAVDVVLWDGTVWRPKHFIAL